MNIKKALKWYWKELIYGIAAFNELHNPSSNPAHIKALQEAREQ